ARQVHGELGLAVVGEARTGEYEFGEAGGRLRGLIGRIADDAFDASRRGGANVGGSLNTAQSANAFEAQTTAADGGVCEVDGNSAVGGLGDAVVGSTAADEDL